MAVSDTVKASGNLLLKSAAEGPLGLKRKSVGANSGISSPRVYRPTMVKQEKKESRKKLKLELEQLQEFTSKIEERVFQLKTSCEYARGNTFKISQVSKTDGVEGRDFMSRRENLVVRDVCGKSRSVTINNQTSGSIMVQSEGNSNIPCSIVVEKRIPKANQMYHNSDFVSGNQKLPLLEKSRSRVSTGSRRLATKRCLLKNVGLDSKLQQLETMPHRQIREIMRQCGTLLKRLMSHKHGWVFNEPVDAVKLGLLDYHTVIHKPMDLGTIKTKLASGQYSHPLEFAADVRLTFSNAMKYNPKGHDVHIMACILQNLFEAKWRFINEKTKHRLTQTLEVQDCTHELVELKQKLRTLEGEVVSLSKSTITEETEMCEDYSHRRMSLKEKIMLIEKLKTVHGDVVEGVIHILKKRKPDLILDDADVEVDFESLDARTLWELANFLTSSGKSKGKCGRITQKKVQTHIQDEEESKIPPSVEIVVGCETSKHSGFPFSAADSGAGRSPPCHFAVEDAQAVEIHVHPLNKKKTEHTSSRGSSDDNLGFCSFEVEESEASNDAATTKFQDTPAQEISPDKLLRAALLKGRFAETILKAQEKTLPVPKDSKADTLKLKKEREENERRKREEKKRLAEAAYLARQKADADAAAEIRRKREEEREAARLALQQMERTVEFNQEIELSRDFGISGNGPPEQHSSSIGEIGPICSPDDLEVFGFGLGNPLEQLGLFMKDDHEDDDEQQRGGEITYGSSDVEEGEI